jgi:UDP-4-amino-4,6-dideoxy-N-acetyl-beta-L-altrosamine transaminase
VKNERLPYLNTMDHFIPYGRQSIDQEDIDAVVSVLASDWLTTGPNVPAFEKAVAGYTGCRHAVAVNSGTSALDIAVQVLALPHGSEVITTPFTFAATSNAILYNGLVPVYADIIRGTRNIDPESIRRKITPKTRAVIIVDFAGLPCDLRAIRQICRDHDLVLIEDACHALGASCQGRKIGTFADMTCFSFHPVKAITTGEGGMVVTDDDGYAGTLALLRTHGIDRSLSPHDGPSVGWEYDMVDLGRNYRMTDIQAVLGITQLKHLDRFVTRRTELAAMYADLLADCSFAEIPVTPEGIRHAWHIYTVLLSGADRNAVFSYMRQHKVGVNVHYLPTYRLRYYREHLPQNPADYPVTEEVFSRIITLPLFPGLTEPEIQYVVETLKDAMKAVR